jgi:hypothetical protein
MTEETFNSYSIAPKRKKDFTFGCGCLSFLCLFLALVSIFTPAPVQDKVIILMVYAAFLVLISGSVWHLSRLQVTLSESGIIYHTSFFSLACAWKDIDGVWIYPQRGIYIHSNQKVQVSPAKALVKILTTRDEHEIPLFLFHDPPDRKGRIKLNAFLMDFKKFAPHLVQTLPKEQSE